jgi:hypothetical protein
MHKICTPPIPLEAAIGKEINRLGFFRLLSWPQFHGNGKQLLSVPLR